MPIVMRFVLVLAAFAGLLGGAQAAPAAADSDADFLLAKALFDKGERFRLDQVAPRLAGHPLEIYVEYWRLKLGLDTASDEEVRAFLTRHSGSWLADRLRVEWLKSLGKRGQWGTFGVQFEAGAGDDTELACYGIQYRRQREPAALSSAKPLWFTGST